MRVKLPVVAVALVVCLLAGFFVGTRSASNAGAAGPWHVKIVPLSGAPDEREKTMNDLLGQLDSSCQVQTQIFPYSAVEDDLYLTYRC